MAWALEKSGDVNRLHPAYAERCAQCTEVGFPLSWSLATLRFR